MQLSMKAWQGDAPENKIFSGADCWLGLVPYPIAKCIFDVVCFVICCVLLCFVVSLSVDDATTLPLSTALQADQTFGTESTITLERI